MRTRVELQPKLSSRIVRLRCARVSNNTLPRQLSWNINLFTSDDNYKHTPYVGTYAPRIGSPQPKMKGFREHGLEEDAFAEKGNIIAAFDAFCKLYRAADNHS